MHFQQLLCITLLFLAFGAYVSADAFLVDPLVVKAEPGKIIDAGGLQPGESMELIFSTDSGYGNDAKWVQAVFGSNPYGEIVQAQSSEVGTRSLITRISTSTLLPPGTYRLPLTLRGTPGQLEDETYQLQFVVAQKLFSATLLNPRVEGNLNETLHYEVTLVNDSSATVEVRVEPSLPPTWSSGTTLMIKPHSFKSVPLSVTPRFAGPKSFDIHITNTRTGQHYDVLHANLVAHASIKDHYSAGLYGFPFFTISLVANYLSNAFFSLVL
ncbi:MAG: hypothetical protein IPJ89_00415 [Candidatus Iainarchaeum archaeon]|uniref:Uncharacterized protein n=1 Tax=Candidatus Iainarchaeum sp. TaxID=3101447 RepID=A0A7T9DJX0_9ARCH|nr:MAG: hypothetical protein IPJ89_00415 [Candidatus Diapherotrites archaeon]